MSNIFTVKNAGFFLAVILSVASPIVSKDPVKVDFDPFGSSEPNTPSTQQIVIDQSPVIPQIEFTNKEISMAFQIIIDATGVFSPLQR